MSAVVCICPVLCPSMLPHQFVAVGVEGEGGGPAAFSADFGDFLLDFWGDGEVATAIAIIHDA